MDYWQGIIGCGLVGYPVASLAQVISPPPTMEAVIQAVIKSFAQTYNFEVIEEVL
jgi:lipoate-protein ligase B